MTQRTLAGMETASDIRAAETDLAARSDDPTPRGTVRAVLEAAELVDVVAHDKRVFVKGGGFSTRSLSEPVRVLDVCAGHGAWASEMRRLAQLQGWPVHITGVEIHAPREPDLRKWCDEVLIGDWRRVYEPHVAYSMNPDGDAFDLVIGNPHFPALTGDGDGPSMPDALLEHAPAVLLLHTQQAFLKSEAGRAAWRRCPPAASWLVPGSVKFRNGINPKCPKCKHVNRPAVERCDNPINPYDPPPEVEPCGAKLKTWGADSRCYQVTLWLRGHVGPTATHLLDDLPASARAWVVAPGSEQPSADLPAAPGWTPTET